MEHQNPYKHLDDHSNLAYKQLKTEKAKVKEKKVNFLKS